MLASEAQVGVVDDGTATWASLTLVDRSARSCASERTRDRRRAAHPVGLDRQPPADEIGQRIGEHLELTVIAVGVGFVIAFALRLIGAAPSRLVRAGHLGHRHPLHDPEPGAVRVA